LNELGLDQKDLATAAQVTESYVSQLLARKKTPPAPGRTDIYEKFGQFLKLPGEELAKLAAVQRQQELKKKIAEPPKPLFKEGRDLILRKAKADRQEEMRRIFEKEPFGELERLITQKLLDVVQGVARDELRSEDWLRSMARAGHSSYEQMRVAILDFLDTDIFHVSIENCVAFLDPIIDSWSIDLKTFGMEVRLNRRLAPGGLKRFEFVEISVDQPFALEPGFEQFLKDKSLSGDATGEEIEFLKSLKLGGRRPSPLYYYRELQNLRDPIHFNG
jgi:transcriptional regulator with XRE-family HTH domain